MSEKPVQPGSGDPDGTPTGLANGVSSSDATLPSSAGAARTTTAALQPASAASSTASPPPAASAASQPSATPVSDRADLRPENIQDAVIRLAGNSQDGIQTARSEEHTSELQSRRDLV